MILSAVFDTCVDETRTDRWKGKETNRTCECIDDEKKKEENWKTLEKIVYDRRRGDHVTDSRVIVEELILSQ